MYVQKMLYFMVYKTWQFCSLDVVIPVLQARKLRPRSAFRAVLDLAYSHLPPPFLVSQYLQGKVSMYSVSFKSLRQPFEAVALKLVCILES